MCLPKSDEVEVGAAAQRAQRSAVHGTGLEEKIPEHTTACPPLGCCIMKSFLGMLASNRKGEKVSVLKINEHLVESAEWMKTLPAPSCSDASQEMHTPHDAHI